MITIRDIETFCLRKGISYSRFGMLAINNPNFAFQMAAGKEFSSFFMNRIKLWMEENVAVDLRTDRDRRKSREQTIDTTTLAHINSMELVSRALLGALWLEHGDILKNLAKRGLKVCKPNGERYVAA